MIAVPAVPVVVAAMAAVFAMVVAAMVVVTLAVVVVVMAVTDMAGAGSVVEAAAPGEVAHGAHGAHGAGVVRGPGDGHTPTMPIHTPHITSIALNATAVSVLQMVFA